MSKQQQVRSPFTTDVESFPNFLNKVFASTLSINVRSSSNTVHYIFHVKDWLIQIVGKFVYVVKLLAELQYQTQPMENSGAVSKGKTKSQKPNLRPPI